MKRQSCIIRITSTRIAVLKSAVSNTGNNQTFNSFPVEQVIEIFEKLLDKQKEQFETLKKEKK